MERTAESEHISSRSCACAWQGCANAGEYRAPKDRRLKEYLVFCLEHVRAYNARWDYHKGYTTAELEAEIRSMATWERPTWKMGTLGGGSRGAGFRAENVRDPFGFAEGTDFDPNKKRKRRDQAAGTNVTARDRALGVLELTWPLTLETLKQRYKVLVKRHHPDANGGSAEAETRMKVINEAYQTLRTDLTVVPAEL